VTALPPTARATLAALDARELSAAQLVDALLERIDAQRELGCFALVDAEGARAAAHAADAARAAGAATERPLLGLPIVVKDLVDVAGLPTTAGSRSWSRVARGDAAAVRALRAAGAVVLGKGHTNEWAFGIDGRNPWRAPCRNPHDHDRLPGGSSSGPAVAVAAGLALGGVGTDTSGSIRVPAALCGVVGLRPTPGRVPLAGVLPLAPSYDVAGPLAVDAEDAALLLAAMAGPPPTPPAPPAPPASAPFRPRVALVTALVDAAHPTVAERIRALAADLGAEEVTIAGIEHALEIHAAIQLHEAARVHAARGGAAADLAPDVAARIEAGAEIDDTDYAAARAERARLAAAVLAALDGRDALLAPTAPVVAPPRDPETVEVGAGRTLPVRDALLSCVVPFSQVPAPAVSVPLPGPGLPVGAQLVGRPGADEALLALAGALSAPGRRP
jgi:Asp-tRNA(Asn)/Glu-tRNA(Gln) amidotransferase A subunit family amidase